MRRLPLALAFMTLACPAWAQSASDGQSPPVPPTGATRPIRQTVTVKVTVTATRAATPVGETGRTTYLLDAADLKDLPALTLDETLRSHAGFDLFRRAPSRTANPTSEGVSLRGLGSTAASRTLVLADGAPLNDPFGGWIHWDEIPALALDSVTLVTGGGSDLYGSSALAGVIDVATARAHPSRATFDLAGGAEDTSHLGGRIAGATGPVDALLAGESLRTAGYILLPASSAGAVDTPANVRSQAFHTELGRRDRPSDRLFLTGNLLNEDRSNGTPLQTNGTRLWRYLGGANTSADASVPARLRLFGSDEGYRQSFSAITANRSAETLTRLQRVRTQEIGATGDASLRRGPIALVFGADARDIRARDDETPVAKSVPTGAQNTSARQRFVGGFAELLGTRGPWSATASIRIDNARNLPGTTLNASATGAPVAIAIPDRAEIVPSPRAGIVRSFGPRLTARVSGFRAFRTPTMNELYRTGQVGQEITLANAALRSERATGFETGADTELANGRVHASGTYFWTAINRPVSAVLVSATPTTITNRRENLGQIRSRGVELALDLDRARPLSASFGYQFADAIVTRFPGQPALVGKRIPQVPRHSATAQVRAASDRFGYVLVAARYGGRAFDDASNRYPLASFFDVSMEGARPLGKHVEAYLLLENVLAHRAEVARTPVLTLGPPLFADAGLRIRLGARDDGSVP